jgi:hypothetical protein
VALPALTGDAGWLRAFHAVVPPLLWQFRPQILVSQHGCDSHRDDPLTNLELSIDAQREAHAAIHRLAHEYAGGRWLLTGGGGYEHVHVVPRSWTHLLFEAAGRPLDPASATPGSCREYVSQVTSQAAPETMTEGGQVTFAPYDNGHDPVDPVDQAVMATRNAVSPCTGSCPETAQPAVATGLRAAADRHDVDLCRLRPVQRHIAPVRAVQDQDQTGTRESQVTAGTPETASGEQCSAPQHRATSVRPPGRGPWPGWLSIG